MCDFSRSPPLIVIHTKWGYYGNEKDEEYEGAKGTKGHEDAL